MQSASFFMMRPLILRPCRSVSLRLCRAFSSSRGNSQLQLAYNLHRARDSQNATSAPKKTPIVFMHGLFGSKQNNRSVSKALADKLNTDIYAIDLRNHGDSPHHPEHNYSVMANDVEEFIHENDLEKPVLIGHSMGAKTAMTIALRHPNLVGGVISVDNAPVRAPLSKDFAKYIRAMKEIEAAKVTKQKDADAILQPYEDSIAIRSFLLTNLIRCKETNTLKFRIPIHILGDKLDNMADFPFTPEESPAKFEGPALFIRGTKSHYVKDSSLSVIKLLFPAFRLQDIDAGHWVISEKPHEFQESVVEFFQRLP
ncbi:alpha/beta hydrolase [Coccidioides immitis RS]|uniref:Alpha/beta hydrolase n=3 Tax=Coccidioides immitis TaxID=5501 RepID=J3K7Z1_COCIM|nr:alpha/beta hydrolase [Coccidioides immitis RS]EAS30866.3 alpha/beta hydrolase [Coccidioides immitis RS]KMP03454.1 abhydrolase domain-containing protein 11 [Coccidioides immitis RMSCC 2394]KMU82942.1 abhydrolase domain-containing protein 11 [Coccidioides immitis H538.4]